MREKQEGDAWRTRYNYELGELFYDPPVSTLVKIGKLQWAGHIEQMHEGRIPKRVLKSGADGNQAVSTWI